MLENFFMVGQQVLILFVLILIGVCCSKLKIINEKSIAGMTNIVLYFVTPCVIIKSFQRTLKAEMVKGLLIVFGIAFVIHIISILITKIFLKDNDENRLKVLRFSVIFSNCGFMSLPLQQALMGDDGVFYGAVYVAAFNIIVWSYGLFLMSGSKSDISIKKLVLNPGLIGVALGLVLAICSIKLPYVIAQPVGYLAALNTPLPMIIIGFYVAQLDFKNLFKDVKKHISILLKLVVIPLLSIGVMILFGVRNELLVVCTIAASAPAAAMTTMFSTKFNRDTKLSAELVALSTLISMITMPIIIAFAQYLTL